MLKLEIDFVKSFQFVSGDALIELNKYVKFATSIYIGTPCRV